MRLCLRTVWWKESNAGIPSDGPGVPVILSVAHALADRGDGEREERL